MAKYIVVALHNDEDANAVASDLSNMLAHAGVVREVLSLNAPSPLRSQLEADFKPDFEQEEGL